MRVLLPCALILLLSGCGTGAMTIGLDLPPEACEAVDVQPGPIWHPPVQFVVCRDEKGRIFLPGPSLTQPSSMLSQLSGPLSSIADRIVIPITAVP
ncbi:MAG: hypothetical protein ACLQAT_26435 [Candidatus Binataceae bacterium]